MSTSVTVLEGARKTVGPPRTCDLSPACRSLLELICRVNFGRIEALAVRGGEPVLDPPPRVVRAVRLAEVGPSRPEPAGAQYSLKREQIAMVEALAAIGTGVIEVIKVHDGLPVVLEIHEQV
jgi:hypothetical protein